MSYAQMLYAIRFESFGNEIFMGDSGKYFFDKLAERKKAFTDAELLQISKDIGWEK